ncbi:hypothetical protein RhiJN_15104 [Ceratobasidium sp. AG-Ba]|nr:hypothetical protein RhiJN_15104 [Ceratobasidium sp. AG-Ba]
MAPGGYDLVHVDSSNTAEPLAEITPTPPDSSNPFAQFDPTIGMTHLEQLDHALVRLLCDSGTPARLVDYPAWKRFVHLLNPQLNYSLPSSSQVSHKLVPAEALRSVLYMREYLKTQANTSLSFNFRSYGPGNIVTRLEPTFYLVEFLKYKNF